MLYAGLVLRGVDYTVSIADSKTLRYRDGYSFTGSFLERDCRNEEGEGCKNESGGEVHPARGEFVGDAGSKRLRQLMSKAGRYFHFIHTKANKTIPLNLEL